MNVNFEPDRQNSDARLTSVAPATAMHQKIRGASSR